MFYRLQVGTLQGESRGYQWLDLDQMLFVDIICGARPVADQEAQSRDSTAVDTAGLNRVMHYLAVWNHATNAWQTDLDVTQADSAWQSGTYSQEQPGA